MSNNNMNDASSPWKGNDLLSRIILTGFYGYVYDTFIGTFPNGSRVLLLLLMTTYRLIVYRTVRYLRIVVGTDCISYRTIFTCCCCCFLQGTIAAFFVIVVRASPTKQYLNLSMNNISHRMMVVIDLLINIIIWIMFLHHGEGMIYYLKYLYCYSVDTFMIRLQGPFRKELVLWIEWTWHNSIHHRWNNNNNNNIRWRTHNKLEWKQK